MHSIQVSVYKYVYKIPHKPYLLLLEVYKGLTPMEKAEIKQSVFLKVANIQKGGEFLPLNKWKHLESNVPEKSPVTGET